MHHFEFEFFFQNKKSIHGRLVMLFFLFKKFSHFEVDRNQSTTYNFHRYQENDFFSSRIFNFES